MKVLLTNSDYCRAAAQLGCEPAMIAAVAGQESLGAGFDSQDRPKVLFERHIFHRLTNGIYDKSHPDISNSSAGGYGRGSQYARFLKASALNQDAAMKATSWGKFQILGQNYAICGYRNVGDFVTAMRESEAKQLDAFVAFCAGHGLDQYLTANDPAGFANGYNGHGYRKNHYDTKIEAGYRKLKGRDFGCGQDTEITAAENPTEVTEVLPIDSNETPEDGTPETPEEQPLETPQPLVGEVEVKAESPSLYTKVGAAVTAITGFGINLGSLIQTKLAEMPVQQIVYMVVALGLVAGGIYWYRKSAKSAQIRTLALVAAAADPKLNTVKLKS